MNEKLSALMDGELGDGECGGQIGRLKGDAGLRRSWDTYHLIGDALRGHVCAGFSARVARRLEQEPTVLAPKRLAYAPQRGWHVMAAAAGVAAVALVVWTALPIMRPQPELAASVPAADSRSAAPAVDNYLLAHQPYSHTGAMQSDLAKAGWIVRSSPPGYHTVTEMTRTLGGTAGVGHIVLSDGLAAVSVFIEPAKQPAPQPGLVRQGAVNVYMRQLGNYRITAVGEAPAESVKYIADAVEYRK